MKLIKSTVLCITMSSNTQKKQRNPICELCSSCVSNEVCSKGRRKCLIGEKPFCGTGYNYCGKHFCSVICMKIQHTIDIEEEDRLREEREKTIVNVKYANYSQGGGSAY